MANIQGRNALVSFGRVTWIAALVSVASCHDAPSANRAPEWVVLSAHEETQSPAMLAEDHPPADLIQHQERLKTRAAAVKAHQQSPSMGSGAALARAYFPEFAFSAPSDGGASPEKQAVRDAQRL